MLCSFIWFFIFSTISQQSIKFRIFEEPVCPLIFDICCRQQPNSVRMTFPHLLFFFLVVEAFWCDIPHLLYLAVCCSKGEEERLPFHCIFFFDCLFVKKTQPFKLSPFFITDINPLFLVFTFLNNLFILYMNLLIPWEFHIMHFYHIYILPFLQHFPDHPHSLHTQFHVLFIFFQA